jgi:hypothetical protein
MKNLLFLIVLGILPFCGHSQTFADDSKWEIGVNFLPLFDSTFYLIKQRNLTWTKSAPLKNVLLVRRKISNKLKVRSSLGLKIHHNESIDLNLGEGQEWLFTMSDYGGYLSAGVEYYFVENRIAVFGGGELFGAYMRSIYTENIDTRPLANPPTVVKVRDFVSTKTFGFNSFIGVSFEISPHLSLMLVTELRGRYNKFRYDYKQRNGPELILTVYGDTAIKEYAIDLNPISFFGVIYNF